MDQSFLGRKSYRRESELVVVLLLLGDFVSFFPLRIMIFKRNGYFFWEFGDFVDILA